MKIALLGTNFGQAHAAVYAARDDVEVVMFGRDADKTAGVAGQFGFAAGTDLDAAFTDPSFDLVDVCLPIPLHAPMVLRALEAGKHVLTELPMAGSLEEGRRIVAAAESSDQHVFVDMFERFIPANQALTDAVRDGTYGRLQELACWNAVALLWPGASLGLKQLPMEAMHSDLDLITRALGTPDQVHVTAVGRDADAGAVEATLAFDGAIARSSLSSLRPKPWGARSGYTAAFTHGVLEWTSAMGYDGKPTGTLTAYTEEGAHEVKLAAADQYTAMIDHVLAVLRGEATNEISPASALAALDLTCRINEQVNPAA
ncbi:gfo/Idh/MocA family oxidoreductase [Streptomyces sp. WAC 01529]|uniref:Gfo/Idh/MocA family protein n=1 Tax=Streptomyces sp. WAC 01529 TaxID=2203205 RepID=UPI000F7148E1|nr:Gfo/Idh/MocA family oxidoreductase [Streptomyces sp. WAC 01529]AZM51273.1 gfo/Idh/MocA family oxidoreductase [Streptomyces sp. WAC 01529]